jgi:hypothetical protein
LSKNRQQLREKRRLEATSTSFGSELLRSHSPHYNQALWFKPALWSCSFRRLAVALQVSADVLIFGADERGPDGDLRLQFEAISKFAAEEKKVIKALLEGMILKHEAKRWSSAA